MSDLSEGEKFDVKRRRPIRRAYIFSLQNVAGRNNCPFMDEHRNSLNRFGSDEVGRPGGVYRPFQNVRTHQVFAMIDMLRTFGLVEA
jgi:hypothetical protein